MSKELTELGEFKVGDKVCIEGDLGRKCISTITKISDGRGGTIYASEMLFDKNGSQRGADTWHKSYMRVATEADVIDIRGKNARNRISKYKWLDLDPAKALEIEKLLNDNGIVTKEAK